MVESTARMQRSAVPARPAPAPPPPLPSGVGTGNPNRYTPTTNWDDSPFDAPTTAGRKVPPPRPPPPRVQPSPIGSLGNNISNNNNGGNGKGLSFAKKATPQSVNILSNLFGSRGSGGSKGGNKSSGAILAPPPPVLKKHHQPTTSTRVTTGPLHSSSSSSSVPRSMSSATNAGIGSELIDWSSPPSSPTLTHKTFNSDCISVDSFSSETHSNSSPQNGSYYSQAESGFEDDFSVQPQPSLYSGYHQDLRKSVSSQISQLDPFSAPPMRAEGPKIRQVPPPIAQKPKIVDQSAFYTQNSISFQAAKPFDDPLSNGKSLIAPPQPNAVSMPTIIKPVIMAKPVGVPLKDLRPKAWTAMKRDASEEEKTPSPPMPIYAPPPPPPEYYAMQEEEEAMPELQDDDDGQARESYGIALYDYDSEHDGDLSFRANDKIYLVRQENAEWMFGRCKRGCEGLFPTNYIEIKVPLTEKPNATRKTNVPAAVMVVAAKKEEEPRRCRALYDFNAEAAEDLSITEGEIITVVWEVNAEWLMGRKKNGTEGQFPAAFVEYL